jgi:ATP-dependent metalloprotease
MRHISQLAPFHRLSKTSEIVSARTQHRSLSTDSSRNLLAHMEKTANNNPTSATAQNAFYQALLRANLPEIIVERYQTGQYATNATCESTYLRALERVGASENAAAAIGSGADLQAAGQAAIANMRGGRVALQQPKSGTGDKTSPMYVVVEETIGSVIFKWVKMLLWFGFIFYFGMITVQIFIEMSGVFRKVGSGQQTQAEAKHQTVRFADVHGCDEAKDELQEVVEFLKNPDKFNTLGGKLPKGVLLVGPPGTGKTLLARAVAGEAGVPFFFMSGSEFDEVYVGVGAKRVRELFNAARAKAPSIVFIDELDAIGGKRNERDHAYAKQTLNQLLVDLDGFSQNSGVVFLAATNFPQSLDQALTRPGRFDRHIVVGLPDVRGRTEILKHHLRNISFSPNIDPSVIARGTPGFSGAQLENIVNSAAIHASRRHAEEVDMKDLDWAKDKIMMGAERRMQYMPPEEKLKTAYHEGGHTLVGLFTEGATPVYKVTVMPRGMALGVTHFLEEMDKHSMSISEFYAQLDVSMGGKVAEEIIYGERGVTSGSSSVSSDHSTIENHF